MWYRRRLCKLAIITTGGRIVPNAHCAMGVSNRAGTGPHKGCHRLSIRLGLWGSDLCGSQGTDCGVLWGSPQSARPARSMTYTDCHMVGLRCAYWSGTWSPGCLRPRRPLAVLSKASQGVTDRARLKEGPSAWKSSLAKGQSLGE